MAATSLQLLLAGRAGDAAAALEALYATGEPHQVSRVAAAAVVDAVDCDAADTVAAVDVLLWRRGQLELLRDVQIAVARGGWVDAAAEVAWRALRGGQREMVADVAAAMLGCGAIEEAAELVEHMAVLSHYSPAITKVGAWLLWRNGSALRCAPLSCFALLPASSACGLPCSHSTPCVVCLQVVGASIMAAVCAGWAADAAAVAAQLLHDGHQDLLRDVAVYQANSGGLRLGWPGCCYCSPCCL